MAIMEAEAEAFSKTARARGARGAQRQRWVAAAALGLLLERTDVVGDWERA